MIKVELTRGSRATLRSLEKRFPKTMRSAFGAAAVRARRRLAKVMRQAGGVYAGLWDRQSGAFLDGE